MINNLKIGLANYYHEFLVSFAYIKFDVYLYKLKKSALRRWLIWPHTFRVMLILTNFKILKYYVYHSKI